jgi:AcrR family transcriptional regulator
MAIPARYHHGDLRAALIAEGLRLLEQIDPDQLSLREMARNVGVSAMAVYRHFPDKEALLRELAQEGYRQLAERQIAAAAGTDAQAFARSGRAYVHFALDNPGLFRLAFSRVPMLVRPGTRGPPGSADGFLRSYVDRALGPHASEAQRFAAAMRAWSLVHGLAMLILDRQVEPAAAKVLIDEIVSAERFHLSPVAKAATPRRPINPVGRSSKP